MVSRLIRLIIDFMLLIGTIIITFGVVLPALFSAPSNVAMLLGFLILTLFPICVIIYIKIHYFRGPHSK